jgi:hypothetical protein
MKCSLAGKENCRAGTEDLLWLIGYIYCDHAEEHEHHPGCDIRCKINPGKVCEDLTPMVMIKRTKQIEVKKKPITGLFD